MAVACEIPAFMESSRIVLAGHREHDGKASVKPWLYAAANTPVRAA